MGHELFGERYHGTYSSDELPKLTAKKPYAITNVDTSSMRGSHWCSIFRDPSKKKYLIFDSFGRTTKSLIPSAYKKYKPVDADHDSNQKDSQNDCGSRSIAFLMVCDELGFDYARLI